MPLAQLPKIPSGDPAARYSHTHWAWEKQAEHACNAAIPYIMFDRPEALPDDMLSCFPSHERPSLPEVQEATGKEQVHTAEDGIVLLLRRPFVLTHFVGAYSQQSNNVAHKS